MTRRINAGGVPVGGGAPVTIQSMTSTRTEHIDATVGQIKALEAAGCEIVRVAVPDEEAAGAIKEIKKQIAVPLVADIHFDHKLALLAVAAGADKIRINPGNIGGAKALRAVADACRDRGIPIRIGVNNVLYLLIICCGSPFMNYDRTIRPLRSGVCGKRPSTQYIDYFIVYALRAGAKIFFCLECLLLVRHQ